MMDLNPSLMVRSDRSVIPSLCVNFEYIVVIRQIARIAKAIAAHAITYAMRS